MRKKKILTEEQEWFEYLSTPIDISKFSSGAWIPNIIDSIEKNRNHKRKATKK